MRAQPQFGSPTRQFCSHPRFVNSCVLPGPLMEPVQTRPTAWTPASLRVTLNLTLDGCIVPSAAEGGVRVDTAHVAVLDGLAEAAICASIRERLCGTGAQPPAELWERRTADSPDAARTFGLRDEAMRALESTPPDGVVELQSRLALLYGADCMLCHQPSLCRDGAAVCERFVANAAVAGDRFQWHVDADPSSLPPSEWMAAHGTYTNRERGKPLFISAILYLDAEWPDEFEAETHFLDRQAGAGFFVRPKCGRVVLMDQDILHRLSPPSSSAGRPRYSLVWKLLLVPRSQTQRASIARPEWGRPTAFGSAARVEALIRALPPREAAAAEAVRRCAEPSAEAPAAKRPAAVASPRHKRSREPGVDTESPPTKAPSVAERMEGT